MIILLTTALVQMDREDEEPLTVYCDLKLHFDDPITGFVQFNKALVKLNHSSNIRSIGFTMPSLTYQGCNSFDYIS